MLIVLHRKLLEPSDVLLDQRDVSYGNPFPHFLFSCPHLSPVSYKAAVMEGVLFSPEMISWLWDLFFECDFIVFLDCRFPSYQLSPRNARLTDAVLFQPPSFLKDFLLHAFFPCCLYLGFIWFWSFSNSFFLFPQFTLIVHQSIYYSGFACYLNFKN